MPPRPRCWIAPALSFAAALAAGCQHDTRFLRAGDAAVSADVVPVDVVPPDDTAVTDTASTDATDATDDMPATTGHTEVLEVALGAGHTCARMADGAVQCWGWNAYGQLGYDTGGQSTSTMPGPVAGLAGVRQLAVGSSHDCVLGSDGFARCWGRAEEGQTGDGRRGGQSTPGTVPGTSGIAEVVAGSGYGCAVRPGQAPLCWGVGDRGQLGNGANAESDSPVPAHTPSGVTFAHLALGGGHSCALTPTGDVYCWGANDHGQVGDGTTTDRNEPVAITGVRGITQLALGAAHTCALTPDRHLYCWGANTVGQLGDGSTTDRHMPATVAGIEGALEVATGDGHTCVRLGDPTPSVLCWGLDDTGQLGRAEAAVCTVSGVPTECGLRAVPVDGFNDVVQLGLGDAHSCAVRRDHTLWCWGANTFGQLGDDTGTRATPAQVRFTAPGR